MKTQYYTAATLDGFIADPQHSLDWLFQFGGSPDDTDYPDFIREVGALAMGSHTYEWILANDVDPATGQRRPWSYSMPAWVFTTRTLERVEGADIRFVRGDVGPVHGQMVAAAGGRNVWLVGGGELVGQFHDQGLLDEVILCLAPVTLGAGFPLLPRKISKPPLRLLSTRVFGDSFVQIRLEVPRPAR